MQFNQPRSAVRPIQVIPSASSSRRIPTNFPMPSGSSFLIRPTDDFNELVRNNNLNLSGSSPGFIQFGNKNRNGSPMLFNGRGSTRNNANVSRSGNILFGNPGSSNAGNFFTVQKRSNPQMQILGRVN
jgi:hypothetical protein